MNIVFDNIVVGECTEEQAKFLTKGGIGYMSRGVLDQLVLHNAQIPIDSKRNKEIFCEAFDEEFGKDALDEVTFQGDTLKSYVIELKPLQTASKALPVLDPFLIAAISECPIEFLSAIWKAEDSTLLNAALTLEDTLPKITWKHLKE